MRGQDYNNKLKIKDFNVIWENSIDCQKDSAKLRRLCADVCKSQAWFAHL